MRRFVTVCFGLMLFTAAIFANAQEIEPPFLPEDRQVITPQNVLDLEPIANLGQGILFDGVFLEDGTLAAVTTRGVYLYPEGDLSAEPRLIAYDPNPFAARYATLYRASIAVEGQTISVSNIDGTVMVDTVEGITFAGSEGAIESNMAFTSADGRFTVESNFRSIRLSDASTGELLAEIELSSPFSRVLLSPASDRLFVVQRASTQVYDIATSALVDEIEAVVSVVTEDAYAQLVENEATRSVDLVFYDLTTKAETTRIPEATCRTSTDVNRFTYRPETNTLYHFRTGVSSGFIRAYDLSSSPPQLQNAVYNYRTTPLNVAFSADSRSLYVAYTDGNPACMGAVVGDGVVRYDLTTGQAAETLPLSPDTVPFDVATNAGGDVFVGGSRTMAILRGDEVVQVPVERFGAASLALNDAGMPFGWVGNNIVQLDETGEIVRTFSEDVRGSFSAINRGSAIAADDNWLIYIGSDNSVYIHNLITDETADNLVFERTVNNVLFDPVSGLLGINTGTGNVEGTLHDLEMYRLGDTIEPVSRAEVYVANYVADFTPGGEVLATTHIGGDPSIGTLNIGEAWVHFYDTATGERLGGFVDDYVQFPLAFSPDGTLLVMVGSSGNLVIYGLP